MLKTDAVNAAEQPVVTLVRTGTAFQRCLWHIQGADVARTLTPAGQTLPVRSNPRLSNLEDRLGLQKSEFLGIGVKRVHVELVIASIKIYEGERR